MIYGGQLPGCCRYQPQAPLCLVVGPEVASGNQHMCGKTLRIVSSLVGSVEWHWHAFWGSRHLALAFPD